MNQPDRCFKCGQQGHWANACPTSGLYHQTTNDTEPKAANVATPKVKPSPKTLTRDEAKEKQITMLTGENRKGLKNPYISSRDLTKLQSSRLNPRHAFKKVKPHTVVPPASCRHEPDEEEYVGQCSHCGGPTPYCKKCDAVYCEWCVD